MQVDPQNPPPQRVIRPLRSTPETATAPLLPRLLSDSQGSRSLPAHLRVYGPLWEPPAFVYLVYNKLLRVWETKCENMEVAPPLRKQMQRAESDLLYGPVMQLLSDTSFYKSKWNLSEQRENDRWGGWYHHLKLDFQVLLQCQLNDDDAKNYLPVGAQFPAATTQAAPKEPSRLIPSTLINQWSPDANQGSLSLYAGPLIDANNKPMKQEKITFQRFAGCCMNSLIPDKAGYVFNAGAPVWSVDFLPATNLTKHCLSLDRNGCVSAYDFLALSTISQDPGLLPPAEISKRNQANVKSAVQIWSIPHDEPTYFSASPNDSNGRGRNVTGNDPERKDDSPQLVMLLAFPNQATAVRWCPRGGSKILNMAESVDLNPSTQQVDPLGLLAISFLDGVVGLYSVPHPFHAKQLSRSNQAYSRDHDSRHVLTLNLVPVAKLMLPSTSCLTLEWANHDVLAGGCMNGDIVIWHVETLIQLIPSSPTLQEPVLIRPTHLKPMHAAPVRSISWIRIPPINQFGKPDMDGDPCFLASCGYDGSVKMLDTLDSSASNSFLHERGETTSLAFSSVLGCLNMADSDYSIKAICLKPRELGVSKKLLAQLGLVWQIAASDFHSFTAYAAADGVCGLASAVRPQKYRSRATMWAPKVYQMDFNRQTSELRMLDNLMPQPRSQDGTAMTEAKANPKPATKKGNNLQASGPQRAEKKLQQPSQSISPIGVYPAIVGVNCLSWHKMLAKGCVLASGMGCGLVRIDYVEGGFNSVNNFNRPVGYDNLVQQTLELINSGVNEEDEEDD